MQQSTVILDLCYRNILSEKSLVYRHVIDFEELCFQLFPVHIKTQAGVFKFLEFEERFRDGSEKMVGLAVER